MKDTFGEEIHVGDEFVYTTGKGPGDFGSYVRLKLTKVKVS